VLYRIEIENFSSFRERQVVDLRLPRNAPDRPERFAPIFKGSEIRAPKVVGVFGANASGKSNLLRALDFLRWFLTDPVTQKRPSLPCERFNDEDCAERPVRLAVELGGIMTLSRDALERHAAGEDVAVGLYRYELELWPEDGRVAKVAKEVLRQKPQGQGKWQRVFERIDGKAIAGSKLFPLTGLGAVVEKTRDDASLVATLAMLHHEPAELIREAASNLVVNMPWTIHEVTDIDFFQYLAANKPLVDAINRELQRIDVGVEQMELVSVSPGPQPFFHHRGLQQPMGWNLESHGTQSFIRLLPWLLIALERGGIAVIDEIDRAIHPHVLPEIVGWFHEPERNRRDAQLFMACHSATILDDLLKEEVLLCEKDSLGRSEIYGLKDVGAVRRDDNLLKKYLGGVYGAVPHIG